MCVCGGGGLLLPGQGPQSALSEGGSVYSHRGTKGGLKTKVCN